MIKSVGLRARVRCPGPFGFLFRNKGEKHVSLNTYTSITEEEIADFLAPLGFLKVDLPNTAEVTFSKKITFEGLPTICRIYTAIMKSNGQSRPAGKDAIRVCLGRLIDGQIRIFKALSPVRRTGTWRNNLADRILEIGDGLARVDQPKLSELDILAGRSAPAAPAPVPGTKLECPECGAPMVGPKNSCRGVFYGCSRFPACRGARDVG